MTVAIVEYIRTGDRIELGEDRLWTGSGEIGELLAGMANRIDWRHYYSHWPSEMAADAAKKLPGKVIWYRPPREDNRPPGTIY
jgi:hypothetical protein